MRLVLSLLFSLLHDYCSDLPIAHPTTRTAIDYPFGPRLMSTASSSPLGLLPHLVNFFSSFFGFCIGSRRPGSSSRLRPPPGIPRFSLFPPRSLPPIYISFPKRLFLSRLNLPQPTIFHYVLSFSRYAYLPANCLFTPVALGTLPHTHNGFCASGALTVYWSLLTVLSVASLLYIASYS